MRLINWFLKKFRKNRCSVVGCYKKLEWVHDPTIYNMGNLKIGPTDKLRCPVHSNVFGGAIDPVTGKQVLFYE